MTDPWVPSIDLGAARAGAAGRRDVASRIDQACRTSGFLTIHNHGLEPQLLPQMRDVTSKLFFSGAEVKEACAVRPGDPARRGFHRMGRVAASIGVDTPPDLCESFSICRLGERELALGAGLGPDEPMAWPNLWPSIPDFRHTWRRYLYAMERLAAELMKLMALALGLPEHWFDDKIDHNASNLGANFYPLQLAPPEPGQLRKGPHSDWGSLTILMQDSASGLQVAHPSGTWLDVPPEDGSLVINIGDVMAMWTNNRWVSTMHRVVNPPRGNGSARLSLAYFHQPNTDAVVTPVPTCGSTSQAPVTSGEWFARKLSLAFAEASEQP